MKYFSSQLTIVFAIAISQIFIPKVYAQEALILSSGNAWERQSVNPSYFPMCGKLFISIPQYGFGAYQNGANYTDLFAQTASQQTLDKEKILSALHDNNLIDANVNFSVLQIGFKLKNVLLSVGHEAQADFEFNYNKWLPTLLLQGNGNYIGDTIAFGPSFNLNLYHSYFLGASYKINKISIGGKIHLLNGISNFSSSAHSIALYTNPEAYQLEFITDYNVNTTLPSLDSLQDVESPFDRLSLSKMFSKNKGYALDLGLTWDVSEKLQVGIGAKNLLSKIRWDDNVSNYSSKGSFTYEGADVRDIFSDTINFNIFLDTLWQQIKPTETNHSFSTKQASTFHLFANYQLSKKITLNGYFSNKHFYDSDANINTLSMGAMYHPLSWLDLGANYTIKGNSYNNIGLSAALRTKYFQIYCYTDNIIGVIKPLSARNAHLLTGLNFIF